MTQTEDHSNGANGLQTEASSLFAHGGEMGSLMSRIDWAATPLGPVSGWSHALRTMVGLLLRNRFPLLLWWGPRFVQIYNDAYRPIPGAKHPRSLGQPAAECWVEIWNIIGPMIEAPFRGEPATWSDDLSLIINRKGFFEETHFKVAYSPVPDESTSSGIGGVLATVAETTEEVYARRQLATLRDLAAQGARAKTAEQACEMAARTMEANPKDLPSALFYLLDADAKTARLASSAGFDDRRWGGSPPANFAIADDSGGWPVGQVMRERRGAVVDLGSRGPATEPGGDRPNRLVLLPLAAPEQTNAYGVLAVASSPHRELNEQYRTFLDLAAEHVSSAIRNARAHQQERERAEKLAEIDRAKTVFFSNVSHEFRTPLTLMLAPIEEMRAEGRGAPAPDRKEIDLLHRNALRLLKLVNTLLDFSRLEAGRIDASYEPTDLSALTADLASCFRSAVERAGLALVVDCPPLPEPVYVDHDMWEKIVLNLLSNAFKFTFEGAITVRLRAVQDAVELKVADTGVGVAADDLPRLFERFHRIEGARSRSHEGSGIGLALVQELVRLHGGEIRAESRLGQGTEFTVRIPPGTAHLPSERVRAPRALQSTAVGAEAYVQEAMRWITSNDAPSSVPALESVVVRMESAPRERILIVDDNVDMREYLSRLLRERWEIDAVGDGLAALECIRRSPPDLVLTDVMMPGLDGFALLRALRRDAATRDIPVILLSARAGEEATAEGLHAGADDYLVKPFSVRELFVRVTARLADAKSTRERNEQRTNLYRAFMQAPFPLAIFRGPTHIIEAANAAILKAWGKGLEALGQPLRSALPELRDEGFASLLDEVFRSAAPREGRGELGVSAGSDGLLEPTLFTYACAPLLDSRAGAEGVMVCALDITQQVLARQELERVNRAKDEFLATMSHELRTPLNAMLGWATMLAENPHDLSRLKRGLGAIVRNAKTQNRLVNDLLDISRIVSGKLRLTMKRTDVTAVIRAAADVVRPAAESKGVGLVLELDPALGATVGDADRLQQVVWNLLSNAVRFTPRDGTVTVRAERGSSAIQLEVHDNGAGIPREHLPHIFERFRQVDSSTTRVHGGLGLGLAIVRHLVEAHGGTVAASSDGAGLGAVFRLMLPIRAIDMSGVVDAEGEPSADRIRTNARRQEAKLPLRTIRALVVEDDQDSLELIRAVLEGAGAHVFGVPSSRAALDEGGPFDVIISDIGMPEMDGYMLIRRLRARSSTASVPAIALTAYARTEDVERALDAGYQRHVSKPVDCTELIMTVERLVHQAR